MYFLRSIYVWGSGADAVPKGLISVCLEGTEDMTSDVRQVGLELTSLGMFDDSCWAIGCTQDDVDLVIKTVPHEKYGSIGTYLTTDQIVPTWEYELLKQQPGLTISEHTLSEMDDCECCECD